MVFYGYTRDTPGFRPERTDELARRLEDLVRGFGGAEGQMRGVMDMAFLQGRPYVEVGGPFGRDGVGIRKLTGLSEVAVRALVKDADRIYWEVMRAP